MMKNNSNNLFLVAIALTTLFITLTSFPTSATYIDGVGYNLFRPKMNIPQQPHQIQYPEIDTQTVATLQKIREAAVVCDPIVPVMRTVQCEVHTFDECGNLFGDSYNTTQGWSVVVEELWHPGSTNRLVSPLVHIAKGISRFYFTPLRHGLYRVLLSRRDKAFHRDYTNNELRVAENINGAGFTVKVRGNTMKGMSHNLGETNQGLQRMLWTIASHNSEPAGYPPAMPATITFEDKEHRFDDRKFGMLQENVRRAPIQPEAFAKMPDRPAKKDDNGHRLVNYARP